LLAFDEGGQRKGESHAQVTWLPQWIEPARRYYYRGMKRHLLGFIIALIMFLLAFWVAEYYRECIAHDPPCGDPYYWNKPE
jgi:hypothetical protein